MAKSANQPPPGLEPGAFSGPLGAWMRRPLPPWSAHAFFVFVLVVLFTWAAITMLGRVRYLMWWAVIAAFLYFAMAPAVDWLVHRGIKRALATALVMLGLIMSVLTLVIAMTPLLITETEAMIEDVPGLISNVKDFASRFGVTLDTSSNTTQVQSALSALQSHLPDLAGGAVSFTSAVIGGLFEFFVVLLFTFFLLANQDRFRRFLLSFLPASMQTVVGQAWDIAVYKTGGYLYSRILTSFLAGSVVGVTLWLLDCPYALALAIWYGLVSQFLPMIGTYVAAALPLLILVTRDPADAVIFVVVLAVWIPLQDYVISPRVSARTMELAPASALIALLAGGALFGPLGAFLALPAAAVIQSIATAFFPRHEIVESAAVRS
ncbi:MAG: AI-2E family transporter [Candidatus Nanopelagicales bacterium]